MEDRSRFPVDGEPFEIAQWHANDWGTGWDHPAQQSVQGDVFESGIR
jgi:hypothetical protein